MRRQQAGRPADRSERILGELRSEIVSGQLAPGSRMPTRVEIEQSFSASSVTIHRVLSRLANDGFVRVDRRLGTYVSDTPPHLFRYALVFPTQPKPDHWSRLYSSLLKASAVVASERGIEIVPFYDINGHADSPDFVRLVDDLHAQRVAGMAFATPPFQVASTPVVRLAGVPRVVLATDVFEQTSTIRQDVPALLRMVFGEIAQTGNRSVATITSVGRSLDDISHEIAKQGLTTRSYWQLRFDLNSPHTARQVVHLLMSRPADDRPDAIYIDDDNFIEATAFGITDAGIEVPRDLQVFAHANLPWSPDTRIPIRKLGFDARRTMAECITLLELQRNGRGNGADVLLEPQFESDILPAKSSKRAPATGAVKQFEPSV